jgi:NADPH:quinone reductase
MRAIVVADENRAEIGVVEKPAPGAGEIRVRVKAAALNRADLLVLAGYQHGSVGGAGAILGLECAGEVESLGQDVTGVAIGDRVMCSARHAIAEYAVTDAGRATKIPAGMSFEEATTLPVALQTMHDALVTNGRLKKGESVLVQGASSGVGLMALKIAKLMGADLVVGTSTNEARRARLKEFGADLALDSRSPDWVEAARKATGGKGVDLIIDQISGYVANANMRAVPFVEADAAGTCLVNSALEGLPRQQARTIAPQSWEIGADLVDPIGVEERWPLPLTAGTAVLNTLRRRGRFK